MTSFPPLPAPPLLLNHLLGLVFVVHLLFMNFVLASPLLCVWYLWTHPSEGRGFARWLAAVLPFAFTFAINFGVASLLFLQALYPDRFFTANILLGKIWLAIIPLLMLAFYIGYIAKLFIDRDRGGRFAGGLAALVVTGMVWAIALIMVSNYFITVSAVRWQELVVRASLVLSSLTLIPRLLHYVVGAFGVTGFWMIWISWWRSRRGDPASDVMAFRRQGLLVAAAATGVQVIVGVWFLIWLPVEAWDRLFSASVPSMVWISGVAAGLVMLGFLIVANVFPDRIVWQRLSTALLGWTLVGMVSGRDLVRLIGFGRQFRPTELLYRTQPGGILAFVLVLGAGLLALAWMMRLIWRMPPRRKSTP